MAQISLRGHLMHNKQQINQYHPILQLKSQILDKEMESLMGVLNGNTDIFPNTRQISVIAILLEYVRETEEDPVLHR